MTWEYELRPKKIQAFQLTYDRSIGKDTVPIWFAKALKDGVIRHSVTLDMPTSQYAEIITPDGTLTAEANDYIILDNGNFFPCAPNIFELTYQKKELK